MIQIIYVVEINSLDQLLMNKYKKKNIQSVKESIFSKNDILRTGVKYR